MSQVSNKTLQIALNCNLSSQERPKQNCEFKIIMTITVSPYQNGNQQSKSSTFIWNMSKKKQSLSETNKRCSITLISPFLFIPLFPIWET